MNVYELVDGIIESIKSVDETEIQSLKKSIVSTLKSFTTFNQVNNFVEYVKDSKSMYLYLDTTKDVITEVSPHKHNRAKIYLEINSGERYKDIKISDFYYYVNIGIK